MVEADPDEPSQPLMMQPNQALYSPDIGRRHDAYSDVNQVRSPSDANDKLGDSGRVPHHMSKTASHAFAR